MITRAPTFYQIAKLLVSAGLTIALGACGSDGVVNPGSGGTGNTDTDTTSIGPISGFGSIIVNEVRFDDSAATVSDERGLAVSRDALRLGMMVSVSGVTSSESLNGTANTVVLFSEIKGFVESVIADGVVIDGISVRALKSTVIDGAQSLTIGDYVEVYGTYDDSSNQLIATRIERKDAEDFKLRGIVSNWNPAVSRFSLGSITVAYGGVNLPDGFSDGSSIRAYAVGQPTNGVWSVNEVRIASNRLRLDSGRAEVKGIVTRFGALNDFTLSDIPVDGTNALIRDGTTADLSLGAFIEVEGSIQNGRLIATEIEIENGSSSGDDDEFEVSGLISEFTSVANFVVRNTRVDASQSPEFDDGDSSDLASGVCVEIKGVLETDAGGSVVRATRVKFDDDCL